MNPMRRAILAASQNQWMREHAPHFGFMRRASARFLPGEDVQDAITAARALAANGIQSVLSHLGENIADRTEATEVTRHFLELNDRIRAAGIPAEITVKLTQLGLDLDSDFCYENLASLIQNTPADKILWIDMEGSPYVDVSLELYRRARKAYSNVGDMPAGLSLPHGKRSRYADSRRRGDSLGEGRVQRASGDCVSRRKKTWTKIFCISRSDCSARKRGVPGYAWPSPRTIAH